METPGGVVQYHLHQQVRGEESTKTTAQIKEDFAQGGEERKKLQRRAEKREKALQIPPEQRLLEERAKRMEEMADWDRRWAEVGASQVGKPDDEDTSVKPSLFPCSSDNISHKEFFETSENETSEDVKKDFIKFSLRNPSSICSKGQRIRQKEERRERNRQKREERKEQAAATRLFMMPITIERKIGGALAAEPPVPQTRGAAALEDIATIRNKKARRERKRQRERKTPASYLLTQLGIVSIQTKLRNFMMNGPLRKLCNF